MTTLGTRVPLIIPTHAASEHSFDWLLQQIAEPVLVVEHEGHVVAVNQAAAALLDSSLPALQGASLRALLPACSNYWCSDADGGFRADGRAQMPGFRQRQWLRTPGGRRRLVDVVTGPLREDERYFTVVLHEVTDAAQQAALDALFRRCYASFARGAGLEQVAAMACEELALALALPLVMLGARRNDGTLQVQATSAETELWLEMRRIPERWDGTIAGQGPGSSALQSGQPAHLTVDAEGFVPWRAAARQDCIAAVVAYPLISLPDPWALLLCSRQADTFAEPGNRDVAAQIALQLERVLGDVARLAQQRVLATALESAGNAAFLTNADGQIHWCNAAFSALSGYTPEDVRGRNPRFLASGRQGLRYYRDLWDTIRTGKVWHGETVDRDHSGRMYTISQTISPVRVDGCVTHYLSLQNDVTRAKDEQARRELREAVDPVTGLNTRAAFEAQVEAELQKGKQGALVLVELKGYQAAAERMGTALAELAGEVFGERIVLAAGEGAIAAQFAPGEFAVLLRGARGIAEFQALAQSLCESLAQPLPIMGDAFDLAPASAIARCPEDGGTLIELWRCADARLAAPAVDAGQRGSETGTP